MPISQSNVVRVRIIPPKGLFSSEKERKRESMGRSIIRYSLPLSLSLSLFLPEQKSASLVRDTKSTARIEKPGGYIASASFNQRCDTIHTHVCMPAFSPSISANPAIIRRARPLTRPLIAVTRTHSHARTLV